MYTVISCNQVMDKLKILKSVDTHASYRATKRETSVSQEDADIEHHDKRVSRPSGAIRRSQIRVVFVRLPSWEAGIVRYVLLKVRC